MEKDSSTIGIVPIVDLAIATVPTTTTATVTVLPIVAVNVHSTTSASTVHVLLAYAKPFPDISRIEVFAGQNFNRWAGAYIFHPKYAWWHGCCPLKTCMSTLRLDHTQIRFFDIQF